MKMTNILLTLLILVMALIASIYGLGEWNKRSAKTELDACLAAAQNEFLHQEVLMFVRDREEKRKNREDTCFKRFNSAIR